jgi:Tweety
MANPYYVPASKLQQVHNWPRPNAAGESSSFCVRQAVEAAGARQASDKCCLTFSCHFFPLSPDGMHQSTNVFNVDWNSDVGKNYLEGIISLAAVYFVLGALIFLAYAIINVLSCCCRTRGLKNKQRGACTNFCRCLFHPTGWFILSVIVMIALTSAAIANLGNFKSTVNTTMNSLNGIDNLLEMASNQVNGNLTASLGAVSTGLAALLATARANNAPQQMIDQITTYQGYSSSAISSTNTLGSQLNTTVQTFGDAIGSGDLDATKISEKTYGLSAAAFGLFLIFLLFVCVTLIKKPCCAFTFRICNWLVIIAFLICFILSGSFLMVGMVSSDACVNPSMAIAKITNLTAVQNNIGGSSASQTLLYLTSCQNADGSVNPPTAGANLALSQGQQQFTTLQTNFQSFAQQYGNDPTYKADVSAISGALATTQASLNTLNNYVSCVPINTIYQGLVISLCNTGIAEGVLNVWALGTAACIIFFVLATSSTRLAWRHPGDPMDEGIDGEGRGLTIVYNAAQGRTAASPANGQQTPGTLGSGPNYSTLAGAPSSSAGSGKAGAYATSDWR